MSFESRETSIAAGKPIRLYLFERGLLKWRVCNANRPVTYDGQEWLNRVIEDDGIRQTGEVSADVTKITAQGDLEAAAQFRPIAPNSEVAITIIDLHAGEILGRVRFVGSVTDVTWPKRDRCEISILSINDSLEQTGLRLCWRRNCPHSVYDHNCKVDQNAYRVGGVITAVGGITLQSNALSGYPDEYFAGGFLEWNIADGEMDRRGITHHTGNEITLLGPTTGLRPGLSVAFFPGCAGTIAICDAKFNNKDNYGGFPQLAGKSPFNGDPIF